MRGSFQNFRLNNTALFFFTFIGCVLVRGYRGITHDGLFYLAQAFNTLEPGRLSQDLFFQFGSQQSFTLFPFLYAEMIALLGVTVATMLLLLVAKALFALGLLLLVQRLFEREYHLLAILGVLLFSSYYGGFDLLSYNEPFLTGRSLAEPFVLAALAVAINGRYWLALGLLVVATAFHPLPGLGALVVVGMMLAGRYWLGLFLIGGVLIILLASNDIPPFSWLFVRYDHQWWELVGDNNELTRLTLWRSDDWARLLVDLAIVALALSRVVAFTARRMVYLLLGVAAGLFGLAFFAGELGRLQLIYSLQLWRVHWCLHLLACACTFPLALQLWREGREITAEFLILTLLIVGNTVAPFALLATALVYWIERHLVDVDKTPLLRGLVLAGFIAMIVLPAFWYFGGGSLLLFAIVGRLLAVYTALAFALFVLWRFGKQRFYLALIILVMLAAVNWDQRRPLQVALTDGQYSDLFADVITKDSVVYWHEANEIAWAVKRVPNYYSGYQGGGLLFNRDTAMEFRRRDQQLGFLRQSTKQCRNMAPVLGRSASNYCKLTYSEIVTACKRAPELDYIVVREFGGSEHAIATREMAGQLVKLYSCEHARKNGRTATTL